MSLAILFHFLCAQHVSDINISINRSLRLFCWITTLVVLFLVRCVLEFQCGWVGVVFVLQAEACNTDSYLLDGPILEFRHGQEMFSSHKSPRPALEPAHPLFRGYRVNKGARNVLGMIMAVPFCPAQMSHERSGIEPVPQRWEAGD